MPKTNFRPQTDGYDFGNTWNRDDNYEKFILDTIQNETVPILVDAFTTNPALVPLFGALGFVASNALEVIGSFFGIPPGTGLSTGIALGVATDYIKNNLDDILKRASINSYGACGGMAFSSLDYYFYNLVIPKGSETFWADGGEYRVPQGNIDGSPSKTLRDYIYSRLIASYDASNKNGVMFRTLELYLIYKTIPSQFNGGGPALLKTAESEWVILTASIDNNTPLPITMIADSIDVFESHQIVAYGYDGDPYQGTGKIYVYDNNEPNKECELRLDFTGSELNAQLYHTKAGDSYGLIFKSFFCSVYNVAMPPPCLAAQDGILVFPSPCQSINEIFYFDFVLTNIGYVANNPSLWVAPVVNFLPSSSSVPADPEPDLVPLTTDINISLNQTRGTDFTTFSTALAQDSFAKVMIAFDTGNGVEVDTDKNELKRTKSLASADGLSASVSQLLNVLQPAQVICPQKLQLKCDYWFIPGIAATFKAITPFGNDQVSYAWFINSIPQAGQTAQDFTIEALPAAGTTINVKAEITNVKSGCIASGAFPITVATVEEANRYALICRFRQKMAGIGILNQGIDPQAPIEEVANRLNQASFKRIKNAFDEIADEFNSFDPVNIKAL